MISTSLEVGGRGEIGFIIMRNIKDCQHFHGFGSERQGGGWPQNHKKCIGLFGFSWLEVGGRGAAGFRVIRNT